jgi:NTE family protein
MAKRKVNALSNKKTNNSNNSKILNSARIAPSGTKRRSLGLALSGGGSRAIAFHLGCMRTLNHMHLLDRVRVISSVSGGSVIAGMYAFCEDTFEEFDAKVVKLLREGLFWKIASQWIFHPRFLGCVSTFLISGTTAFIVSIIKALLGVIRRFVPGVKKLGSIERIQPPFRRWVSRTSALAGALNKYVYKDARITDKRRNNIDIVINAADLSTGSAFRFGSVESGCYRYGKLINNNVKIARAVAASAAYPLLLPGLDLKYKIEGRDGNQYKQRFILSDGGIYDNLGISCLGPGRSKKYGYNIFPVKYIICCSAGHGIEDKYARPYWWPWRTVYAFKSIFRKFQDSGYRDLFQMKDISDLVLKSGNIKSNFSDILQQSGVPKKTIINILNNPAFKKDFNLKNIETSRIDNFALAYLGKIDKELRDEFKKRGIVDKRVENIFKNLIKRDDVKDYPTDFSKMKQKDIDKLTKRGEQMMELWIRIYCRELLEEL